MKMISPFFCFESFKVELRVINIYSAVHIQQFTSAAFPRFANMKDAKIKKRRNIYKKSKNKKKNLSVGASVGSAHLRQLLGDAPEHVVVQVPGLRQVLHIAGAHVLPAPVLSLHQVPAVSLRQRGDKPVRHSHASTQKDTARVPSNEWRDFCLERKTPARTVLSGNT